VAVSTLFLVNGALLAGVLPRLPLIKETLELSNAELGAAVAAAPIGGLLAGGLAGVLIGRVGSGRLAVLTGLAATLLLVSIALAATWALLAVAFLVIGAFDATMDAAMNAHGVGVQRRYGRSILHGFQGWWSAGTLAGGAAGALAAGLGIPAVAQLGVVGVVLAAVTLVASRGLLPDAVADAVADPGSDGPGDAQALAEGHGTAAAPAPAPIGLRHAPSLLRLLLPITLIGLLGTLLEDAASTWGTLYLADVIGLGAGIAALGFVLYTAAMTVGRLTNDRWVDRYGSVAVARAGGVIAAGGLAFVAAAGPLGAPALAFAGFAAVGIGAAPMFPVMVTAAGERPGIPAAHAVGLVSWLARIGGVAAPLLMGLAADAAGLAAAFLIPMAAALVIVVFARRLIDPRSASRVRPTP